MDEDGWLVDDNVLILYVYGVVRVPLYGKRGHGLYALVSAEDYPLVGCYKWFVGHNGYVVRNRMKRHTGHDQAEIFMHRMIMNAPKGVEVDHRNLRRLDNRRRNLRFATHAQQSANHPRHRHNQCIYKGVRLTAAGHYNARIAGQHLGNFDSINDAARAYNAAALGRFGSYARFNEIRESE